MKPQQKAPTEPLYSIFERHLYELSPADRDRDAFVSKVLKDYFQYLRQSCISIPVQLEAAIAEEISQQVRTMLLKKIYGCFDLAAYQACSAPEIESVPRRRLVRRRSPTLKPSA